MKRIYQSMIQEHIQSYEQMLFLADPRQVGKTTLLWSSKEDVPNFNYYNSDNIDDHEKILNGYKLLTANSNLDLFPHQKPVLH